MTRQTIDDGGWERPTMARLDKTVAQCNAGISIDLMLHFVSMIPVSF